MIRVIIGTLEIWVEVAVTKLTLERGLSQTQKLPTGEGLLLVLDKEMLMPITTQQMAYPIDVIFISEDWLVIDKQSLSPGIIYQPKVVWKAALEVNLDAAKTVERGQKVYLLEKSHC